MAAAGLLSPIVENHEEPEEEEEEPMSPASEQEGLPPQVRHRDNTHPWPQPNLLYVHSNGILPTSLPEIPRAVSPQPVSPQEKARENWSRAVEVMFLSTEHRGGALKFVNEGRGELTSPARSTS